MKRAADTDKPIEGRSSSGRNQTKRPKTSQACSSCRKHKTRCELLDGPSEGPYRCHRCKVLNIPCSFEGSDFAPPLHHSPSPPTRPTRASFASEPARLSPPNLSSTVATPASDDTHSVKMEDLLPLPPKPWGFVKVPGGFDWAAAPMLAMQNVTNRAQLDEDVASSEVDALLADILTPDTVRSLLNIFESIYCPWLNLQPNQGGNSPLLTLARCMVASRHLDTVTRASVVPRLQKLTEKVIFRHLFNPIPSTQSIQAILILSLWSPIGGSARAEVRDGRLLIACGVSMAMNLRLSQAAAYVAGLRDDMKKDHNISHTIASDLEDAMEKARLWLSLMNAESMLCIGTGRVPLSHRTAQDFTVVDFSSSTTISAGRDQRLSLMGQIFDVTEMGLRVHFTAKSEIDRFYRDVAGVLMKLDNLQRLISPLPVVVEQESFYFFTLRIHHHACRLLFLHHCLHEARRVIASGSDRPWYLTAEYNGVNIASQYGQEAMLMAEDILVSTISRQEVKQLGAAPDNVFAMICFAASFLVMCKISVYQSHGIRLPGSSDGLLTKITDRLLQAACGPDHAPAKCAQLIRGLISTYEVRCSGEPAHPRSQYMSHNVSSERTSATLSRELESAGYPVDGHPHFDTSFQGHDPTMDLMNSDVMLDSDFWASFMDNLTVDMESVRND